MLIGKFDTHFVLRDNSTEGNQESFKEGNDEAWDKLLIGQRSLKEGNDEPWDKIANWSNITKPANLGSTKKNSLKKYYVVEKIDYKIS